MTRLLPLLLLASSPAWASAWADKWASHNADVRAEGIVRGTPSAVFTFLSDLRNLQRVLPADCVGKWEHGVTSVGLGATAVVRYDLGMMHRTLTMTLSRAEPERFLDFDHPGDRGFITRWTLTPDGDTATRVTVLTPLNPPPRLVQGYYFQTVQPEWKGCYDRALSTLDAALNE